MTKTLMDYLQEENEISAELKAQNLGNLVMYLHIHNEPVQLRKPIMEHIRDESECNYSDIFDYFKDLNQCGAELKAKYLVELLTYVHEQEQLAVVNS